MTPTFHPLANLFPLIRGEEFDALVADIKARGLRQPVTLLNGSIIDGRNRARACEAAGVECHYENIAPDIDPLHFVISANIARRHLSDGQRAYVAAKLATLGWGGDRSKSPNGDLKTEEAARLLNVAKRSVERARVVRYLAIPELQDVVENGRLPVAPAAALAKLPANEQRDALQNFNGGSDNAARRLVSAIKKSRRAAREADLGAKQHALPDKKYGVIYADPEWRFDTYSRETGMDRAAGNHYPTSETTDICARDVAAITADDCVLFLWSTQPMLPDALRVMEAWGFTYKSRCVWAKDRLGTGYWFRDACEILLVGVKGDIPAPAMGDQWPSLIEAPVGEHSAKPEKFAEMIEAYFPNLPKIELNRRGPPRPGWDAWGNEAEETFAESNACSA